VRKSGKFSNKLHHDMQCHRVIALKCHKHIRWTQRR